MENEQEPFLNAIWKGFRSIAHLWKIHSHFPNHIRQVQIVFIFMKIFTLLNSNKTEYDENDGGQNCL